MNEEILQRAKTYLAHGYAGPNALVAGDILDILLDILLGIAGDCVNRGGTPESISETMKNRPLIARLAARSVIVDKIPELKGVRGWRQNGGDRYMNAVLHAGETATVPEIKQFCQMAG